MPAGEGQEGVWTSTFPGPASEGISQGPNLLPNGCHQGGILESQSVASWSYPECQMCLSNSPHLEKQVIDYCGA